MAFKATFLESPILINSFKPLQNPILKPQCIIGNANLSHTLFFTHEFFLPKCYIIFSLEIFNDFDAEFIL